MVVFNSGPKADETMKNLGKPKYLKLANFLDAGGCLDVLELEFDVKRIYILRSISAGTIRGNHAHKSLMQIFQDIYLLMPLIQDKMNDLPRQALQIEYLQTSYLLLHQELTEYPFVH